MHENPVNLLININISTLLLYYIFTIIYIIIHYEFESGVVLQSRYNQSRDEFYVQINSTRRLKKIEFEQRQIHWNIVTPTKVNKPRKVNFELEQTLNSFSPS